MPIPVSGFALPDQSSFILTSRSLSRIQARSLWFSHRLVPLSTGVMLDILLGFVSLGACAHVLAHYLGEHRQDCGDH